MPLEERPAPTPRAGRRRLLPTRAELMPALLSAALFAVAFPPFQLIVPAFLCLVPVAVAVARTVDRGGPGRSAARTGFWFGFLGYGANLYWIAVALSIYTKLAIVGYIAALFVVAPVVAAAAAALFVARRATRLPMALLVPVVWVASEVAFNYLSDLAFPWLPLGLAVSRVPVAAQIADLSGVRTVSFWIALTNGLLADAWLLRARSGAVVRRALAVVLAAAAVLGYGVWRMRTTVLRPVAQIGIVQPSIPQEEKWQAENTERIVGIAASLTRDEMRRANDALIVWPEVTLPGFLVQHPEWADTMRVLARVQRTPILFGVLDATAAPDGSYDYFNAARVVDSTGRIGTRPAYHKQFLVPVVERVPFLNPEWFSGLKFFGGYGRGTSETPYRFSFGVGGVLICYESIFPQLSRAYRRNGADLLFNITNDAWFGRTLAPYQHISHLPFRAIENRVGVIRAANTGISAYVDPLGRIRKPSPLYVRGTARYQAQTTDVRTLYTRMGDWLGTLSAAATLAVVAADMVRRRRERRG